MHEWLDLKDLASKTSIKLRALRTLARERKENGLAFAIRKVRGKFLVRTDLFEEWIETHTV